MQAGNNKHGARKVWTCNLVRSTHLHSHFAKLVNGASSSWMRLVNSAFRKFLIFLDSKLSKVNSGIQFHGLRMQISKESESGSLVRVYQLPSSFQKSIRMSVPWPSTSAAPRSASLERTMPFLRRKNGFSHMFHSQ
jgi:hypothetical protein